jgi:hypothetical protein
MPGSAWSSELDWCSGTTACCTTDDDDIHACGGDDLVQTRQYKLRFFCGLPDSPDVTTARVCMNWTGGQ